MENFPLQCRPGIKQECVEEYAQLFEKNQYVFLCILSIDTVVLRKYILPSLFKKYCMEILHHGDHIDDMTKKWLSLTPNPPRIPVFYTLIKIHKPNPVGRPIISGCEGHTDHHLSITYFSLLLKYKNHTSKIRQIS